jgi:aldehyde dehydrogenase (NAD+)
MSREIPDDPSVVQPIFDNLKRNFFTGKTKPLQARKAAVKSLIDGYKALKEEFDVALEKDLGTGKYFSELIVHGVTIDDMEDLHDNLESWAKPESVPTPLGKS